MTGEHDSARPRARETADTGELLASAATLVGLGRASGRPAPGVRLACMPFLRLGRGRASTGAAAGPDGAPLLWALLPLAALLPWLPGGTDTTTVITTAAAPTTTHREAPEPRRRAPEPDDHPLALGPLPVRPEAPRPPPALSRGFTVGPPLTAPGQPQRPAAPELSHPRPASQPAATSASTSSAPDTPMLPLVAPLVAPLATDRTGDAPASIAAPTPAPAPASAPDVTPLPRPRPAASLVSEHTWSAPQIARRPRRSPASPSTSAPSTSPAELPTPRAPAPILTAPILTAPNFTAQIPTAQLPAAQRPTAQRPAPAREPIAAEPPPLPYARVAPTAPPAPLAPATPPGSPTTTPPILPTRTTTSLGLTQVVHDLRAVVERTVVEEVQRVVARTLPARPARPLEPTPELYSEPTVRKLMARIRRIEQEDRHRGGDI